MESTGALILSTEAKNSVQTRWKLYHNHISLFFSDAKPIKK